MSNTTYIKATCFTCKGIGTVVEDNKEQPCFKCRGKGYFEVPRATVLTSWTKEFHVVQ